MSLFRVIIIITGLAAIGGAGYLSHYGVWRDSTDIAQSIRTGSAGRGPIGGRVK